MRVLLVGSPSDRARLRSQMNGSMEIAGEFPSLAAARAADVDHDGILVAEGGGGASSAPTEHERDGRTASARALDDKRLGGRCRPWSAPGEEAGFDESLTPREIQVLEL